MKSQAERRITKSNPDLIYKIGLKGYVVSNSQIAKRELQLERSDNNENHLVGYNQGCTEKKAENVHEGPECMGEELLWQEILWFIDKRE